MASQILTRYLDSSEYEQWDRFVDSTQLGSIYNQSFFLDALCKSFGTSFRILGAFKGDELVGGMGIHFKPSKHGDMVHIRPLLYYNGFVVSDFESKYPSITLSRQTEVVNAILNELESGKYASAEIASTSSFHDLRPFTVRDWRVWPRYTYLVPIADLKKQWEYAEQNIRRLISRCERDGMRLELSDDAEAFHVMNTNTYERKGVDPYASRQAFAHLYQTLKDRGVCQIYFAVTPEGQRAAGQIVLFTRHPVTHTWMAGSDPAFLQSGASAFLRWKTFEDLSQRGYQYNDLTDAMIPPVAKFKSQFGGRLEATFVLYKEFSSRLRWENRIKNITKKPMDVIKARLSRTSTKPEETND